MIKCLRNPRLNLVCIDAQTGNTKFKHPLVERATHKNWVSQGPDCDISANTAPLDRVW